MRSVRLFPIAAVCLAAACVTAPRAYAQDRPHPQPIGGVFDAAALDAARQRPIRPLGGSCIPGPAGEAGKIGACPGASSRNDTAPFLYGDTFVLHVFVNDDGGSWQTSSWWPWDNTRNTEAATTRLATEWIEDESPDDMDVSFSTSDTDSFYYVNATISGQVTLDNNTTQEAITIPTAAGSSDWDGDGAVLDDLLESLRSFSRTSGEWDNMIAILHVHHDGRCFAWDHIAATVMFEGEGDQVYAHEIMHLYGASDEYEEDGKCSGLDGDCQADYPNRWIEPVYKNGNCVRCDEDWSCIMIQNFPLVWTNICSFTRKHVGWGDIDSDGWRDLEESVPWVEMPGIPWSQETSDPSPDFSGTAFNAYRWSPVARVEYRVDAGSWQNATASDGGWNESEEAFSFSPGLGADGDHTIEVRARNSVGQYQNCGWPTYTTFHVTLDRTGPLAPTLWSWSHPDPNLWYSNRAVQIGWSQAYPFDPSGVSGWSVRFNQVAGDTADRVVDTTANSMNLNATSDGIWYAHVRGVDGMGNWGPSAHVTIRIDTVAPSVPAISSTTHGQDSYANASSASFSWSSTDATSGIAGYNWTTSLNQDPAGTVSEYLRGTASSGSFGVPTPDGDYYFHARARDAAGNWSAAGHYRIRADRTPPRLTVTSTTHPNPTVWYPNSSVTYAWTLVAADLSGIWGYSYLDSLNFPNVTPDEVMNTGSTSVTLHGLASGVHDFGVHGEDVAGNWGGDLGSTGIARTRARVDVTDPAAVTDPSSPSHADAIGQYDCVQSADRTVDVAWTAALDAHSGLDGYAICWNQQADVGPAQTKTLEETVTSLTSASLADGESWYFHVRSVDIAGNWDDDFATIGPFFIAATPPPAPANPTVDAGNATVSLRWNAVHGATAMTYKVYRRLAGGSFGAPLAEAWQDTSYTDSWPSVLNGDVYFYAVAAVDSCDLESAKSYEMQAGPEYESPGDGRRWDLTDLVNNSKGGVRGAAPAFTMHGTVTISANDTLDIDPGHSLLSQDVSGTRELRIEGSLIAAGTAAQAIIFGAVSASAGRWAGVHLVSPGAASRIERCAIRDATTGVTWEGGNPLVKRSTIERCSVNGISAAAAPVPGSSCTIRGNTVRTCGGRGISVFGSSFSATQVDSNTVTRNGTGIAYDVNPFAPAPVALLISANDVRNQSGNGIDCGRGAQNVTVGNNTVRENWNGIVFDGEGWMVARPLVTGNDVSGNANAGIYTAMQAAPIVQNNRIVQNTNFGCYSKTNAWPTLTGNTITGSRVGVAIAQSPNAVPDLGNPPVSPGMNRLDGHSLFWVQSTAGVLVNAKSNYWGSAQPNPGAVIQGNVAWLPVWAPPANQPPNIALFTPNGGVARDAVTVTWVDGDPDPADNASINLYYDTDGVNYDGTQIDGASAISENDPANRYDWNTRLIPAGAYHVYALISDGSLASKAYSPGQVTIQHPVIALSADTLLATVEPDQSAGRPLVIRNLGTASLSGGIAEDRSWLSLSDTTFSVAAGDSAEVTVWFDAAGLAESDSAAAIALESDDHADSLVTVAAILHVAKPEIDLDETSIAFGAVPVDSSKSEDLAVCNVGTAALMIDSLIVGGVFQVAGAAPPVTVAPGDTLILTLSYSPDAPATDSADLTIVSNDSDEHVIAVALSGTGLAPEAWLSTSSHDFGTAAAGDSVLWGLTVRNDGTSSLVLASASFDTTGFSLVSPPLAASVAGGDSLTLVLAFTPVEARAYAAAFTLETNDADEGEIAVAVTGTGALPEAVLAGAPVAFGAARTGMTAEREVRVKNLGDETLSVESATTSSPFSVVSSGLPADVSPGDSLALTVRFSPSDLGGAATTLYVGTDAPTTPTLVAALSGTGVSPEVALSETNLDLGAVHADSASSRALWVHNGGSSPLEVASISLVSGERFSLSAPATPFSIAPGDSGQIMVQFAPSPVGPYDDTLRIACDDDDEPALAVPLEAESVAPEVAVTVLAGVMGDGTTIEREITTSGYDFRSVEAGTTALRAVHLRNAGGYPLRLTALSAEPSIFTVTGPELPATIAPGSYSVLRLTFAPPAASAYAGSLSITTNDRETPILAVPLAGEGAAKIAAVSPDSIGETVFEGGSAVQQIHLSNQGAVTYQFLLREVSAQGAPSAATPKEHLLAPAPPASKVESDIAWLSVSDSIGWVLGNDTLDVGVTLDAAATSAGVRRAALLLLTNDADLDSVEIPVVLRVPRMRYADHVAGNFITTVTDEGAVGFWDRSQNETYGSGFVYPKAGGVNYLFNGSLWVGNAADRVSDASYDYDFGVAPGGDLSVSGADPERSTALYRDSDCSSPLGVAIDQEGLAYPAAQNDDFLVLRYTVRNISGAALEGVHVSLFMDWDVPDWSLNEGGYDAATRAGYLYNQFGGDSTHVGIVMLEPPAPASFHFIHHPTFVYPYGTVRDVDKYTWMSDSGVDLATWEPQDWSLVMTAGPFDLPAAGQTRVSFALAAGLGRQAFLSNAAAARSLVTISAPEEAPPARFALHANRPNPFSTATSVLFDLPGRDRVEAGIYDVQGRLVRFLARRIFEPGRHTLLWDGRDESGRPAATGLYFCRVETPKEVAARKILLMR